jgi:acyl carrier protein
MKNQIEKSKIMISVFREFEVPITGTQKFRRFYTDIPVDRFYVEGILFELEARLGILFEDPDNRQIRTPSDVIKLVAIKSNIQG